MKIISKILSLLLIPAMLAAIVGVIYAMFLTSNIWGLITISIMIILVSASYL